MIDPTEIVSKIFRSESGKLLAILTRIFGIQYIEIAEDVLQECMLKALEEWQTETPKNPSAWLFTVAKNKAIDRIRKYRIEESFDFSEITLLKSEYSLKSTIDTYFQPDEIKDHQLRLIFCTCHPALSEKEKTALVLRISARFTINEISRATLTPPETIKKRLFRARKKFKSGEIKMEVPLEKELPLRINEVLKTAYLLFNEGYAQTESQEWISREKCLEAGRLLLLLTERKETANPDVFALLALMAFHSSRFDARVNGKEIVNLENQDRSKWNKALIKKGNEFLNYCAGSARTKYIIEAEMASIHANSASFESTDWITLDSLYRELMDMSYSPIVALNYTVVLSKTENKKHAYHYLMNINGLENYYLFHVIKADLETELNHHKAAKDSYCRALSLCKSPLEINYLLDKKRTLKKQ